MASLTCSPLRLVVTLRGDIDADAEPMLERLSDGVKVVAFEAITVDLARVGFCDWNGLRVVITCAARWRADGRRVTITYPPPSVVRLLAVMPAAEQASIRVFLVAGSADACPG